MIIYLSRNKFVCCYAYIRHVYWLPLTSSWNRTRYLYKTSSAVKALIASDLSRILFSACHSHSRTRRGKKEKKVYEKTSTGKNNGWKRTVAGERDFIIVESISTRVINASNTHVHARHTHFTLSGKILGRDLSDDNVRHLSLRNNDVLPFIRHRSIIITLSRQFISTSNANWKIKHRYRDHGVWECDAWWKKKKRKKEKKIEGKSLTAKIRKRLSAGETLSRLASRKNDGIRPHVQSTYFVARVSEISNAVNLPCPNRLDLPLSHMNKVR